MSSGEEAINGLREALRVSPDNIPLRMHLARSLASFGRFDEAELEFRDALSRDPDNVDIKLGLVSVYQQQEDKQSHAMVLIEDVCGKRDAPAHAYVV